jgi:hypothetical protein
MTSWIVVAALAQALQCNGDAAAAASTAARLAAEMAVVAVAEQYERAAALGCVDAEVPGVYARAWLTSREASRRGGDPESVAPVRAAVERLAARAASGPGVAEIARLVLLASIAAAQSEREEMALYLAQALRLEQLQLMAGEPAAPVIAAHEAAGELWLQVHRYEDARRAFTLAAERLGTTPRVTLGLARASARLEDSQTACGEYRNLTAWWGNRAESPEIAEARAYLRDRCP